MTKSIFNDFSTYDIPSSNIWNAPFEFFTRLNDSIGDNRPIADDILKLLSATLLLFLTESSKHIIKSRLAKFVEAVDSSLAQAAQFIGLIEDRCHSLLLVE